MYNGSDDRVRQRVFIRTPNGLFRATYLEEREEQTSAPSPPRRRHSSHIPGERPPAGGRRRRRSRPREPPQDHMPPPHVRFMAHDEGYLQQENQRLEDQNIRLRNDIQTLNQTLAGVRAERDELREAARRRRRSSRGEIHDLEAALLQQAERLDFQTTEAVRLRSERDAERLAKTRERNEKVRLEAEIRRYGEQRAMLATLQRDAVILTRERDIVKQVARERKEKIEWYEGVVRRMRMHAENLERRLRGY